VSTPLGWMETMTQVAVLPSLDRVSGLRYLAARIRNVFGVKDRFCEAR